MLINRKDRNAKAVAAMFHLPQPWNLRRFVDGVGHARNRRIELLPTTTRGGMCGLWVATDLADYIAFEQHTSGPHREQIVLHELGHMVFGHPSRALDNTAEERYSDTQEREAELFATQILQRAGRTPHPPPPPALQRVADSLDLLGTPTHGTGPGTPGRARHRRLRNSLRSLLTA